MQWWQNLSFPLLSTIRSSAQSSCSQRQQSHLIHSCPSPSTTVLLVRPKTYAVCILIYLRVSESLSQWSTRLLGWRLPFPSWPESVDTTSSQILEVVVASSSAALLTSMPFLTAATIPSSVQHIRLLGLLFVLKWIAGADERRARVFLPKFLFFRGISKRTSKHNI